VAGDTANTAVGLGMEFVVTDGTNTQTFPTRGPLSVEFIDPASTVPTDLPIQPEEVAGVTGLGTLTPERREQLAGIIRGVLGEMASILGYDPVPTQHVETVYMRPSVDSIRGWETVLLNFPVTRVVSAVDQPDSSIVVTYMAGFNVEDTEALRSYLVQHAAARYRASLPAGDAGREVTSMSVEGQSVSYAARPGAGQPGGPPTAASLAYYKRYAVYTRPTPRDPYATIEYDYRIYRY
jgi:hypothetical protein